METEIWMRNLILSISYLCLGLTFVAALMSTRMLFKDWPKYFRRYFGYALAEWSWIAVLYLITDRIILAVPSLPPNADSWWYLTGVTGLSVGFMLISLHNLKLIREDSDDSSQKR